MFGMLKVKLSDTNECFMAMPDDQIAFMSKQDQAPVGYLSKPGISVQSYNLNNTYPKINESVTFDIIPLPYEFALQAVIDRGMFISFFLSHFPFSVSFLSIHTLA